MSAVEEMTKPEARMTNVPTIIRGVLFLPEAASLRPQASSLLDISGRQVMGLRPGANDVGQLAPGVHFVLQQPTAGSPTRVVIAR